MKVGSIHKNSKTRYFAVGGYFCFEEDKIKKIQVTKEEKKILENKTKKSNNIFKRFINKLKPQENKFNFILVI